jgi:hypothetical protein
MRVRRDISSIPFQSASDTWARIVDLVTGSDSRDAGQLKAANGVMGSIIADEQPGRRPILLEGVGPLLRIYCRFGMKTVEEGGEVDALTWNPTAGDWTMHVPCDAPNLAWVRESLAKTSPRIKAFDVDAQQRAEDEDESAAAGVSPDLVIDWDAAR